MGEGIDIYGLARRESNSASVKIARVLSDIKKQGFSTSRPFSIGVVEKRMKDYARENNIELSGNDVYMSSKSIKHSIRKSKADKGIAVSMKDLINFPSSRRKMDLFYDDEAFVYTNYKTKYIVHPNYEIKTEDGKNKKVVFITAGKVTDPNEFKLPKYKKV